VQQFWMQQRHPRLHQKWSREVVSTHVLWPRRRQSSSSNRLHVGGQHGQLPVLQASAWQEQHLSRSGTGTEQPQQQEQSDSNIRRKQLSPDMLPSGMPCRSGGNALNSCQELWASHPFCVAWLQHT
jgi:hypothetical protein